MADLLEADSVCLVGGPLEKMWVCLQAGCYVVERIKPWMPAAVYDRVCGRVQGVSWVLNTLGGGQNPGVDLLNFRTSTPLPVEDPLSSFLTGPPTAEQMICG